MKLLPIHAACLALFVASCGGNEPEKLAEPTPAKSSSKPTAASQPSEPDIDPMTTPATAFAHQLEFLRNKDVEGLKSCLLEPARSKITLEGLQKLEDHYATVPATDIARYVEVDGDTATMLLPSRAPFETMKRVDGKWYSTTRWWLPEEYR